MIRFLIILGLIYFGGRLFFRLIVWLLPMILLKSFQKAQSTQQGQRETPFSSGVSHQNSVTANTTLVEDPVCKLNLPMDQALMLKTKSGTYYFCSPTCKAEFQQQH
jgi:YHS domain-containing protein